MVLMFALLLMLTLTLIVAKLDSNDRNKPNNYENVVQSFAN